MASTCAATAQPSVPGCPGVSPTLTLSRAYGYDSEPLSLNGEATSSRSFDGEDVLNQTARFFLGVMPVQTFLDSFLPWNCEPPNSISEPDFSRVAWSVDGVAHLARTNMHQPLVEALNAMGLDHLCFKVTNNKTDPRWIADDLSADVSVFSEDNIDNTDFSRMETFAKLEKDADMDPFIDPEDGADLKTHNIIRDSHDTRSRIGHATACAIAMMGATYRTHCFSVYIAGDKARFIRWDRAGAVVSRSFNYLDGRTPHLGEFFSRFHQLSPTQRGIDVTVCRPHPDVERTARAALYPRKQALETDAEYEERVKSFNAATLYEYRVPICYGTHEREDKRYVGCYYPRGVCSLVGRCSRGNCVYDIQTGKVRYFKDTWRIDSSILAPEHESYSAMHRKGVRCILSVDAAGDVRELLDDEQARAMHSPIVAFRVNNQLTGPAPPKPTSCPDASSQYQSGFKAESQTRTEPLTHMRSEKTKEQRRRYPQTFNTVHVSVTDKLIWEDWICGDKNELRRIFTAYIHYRIVLDEVGRDLYSFRSTKELLQAMADAVTAHTDAYFLAEILHCDISPGNILIMDDGSGKLIDWDFCSPARQAKAREVGRAGTWQFISGLLLRNPSTKFHEYPDDLESFLHVLTYLVVRYTESSLRGASLNFFLSMYDEEIPPSDDNKDRIGGKLKSITLAGEGEYIRDVLFSTRPGLYELIDQLSDLFQPLYLLERHRTDEHRQQIRTLWTRSGGGDQIQHMIGTLLKSSSDWPSDDRVREVFIDTSLTKAEKKEPAQRQILKRKSQDSNLALRRIPTGSLIASIQTLDGMDERELQQDNRSKRRRVKR